VKALSLMAQSARHLPDMRGDFVEAKNPRVELSFINGLRGLAILLVLADHWFLWGIKSPSWVFSKSPDWLIASGQRGVQLFFIVSAFTLFLSSSHRTSTEAHPIRNFYLRRAFRILPLWWCAMFFYALYFDRFTFQELAPNLWMYFGFYRFTEVSFADFQWSLFVEETFYVGFPLFLGLLSNLRAALALLAITYGIAYLWIRLAPLTHIPTANYFIEWFPLNHWPAFAMGIVLAFLWKQNVLSRKREVLWLYIGLVPVFLESFNQAADRGLLAVTALFVLTALPSGPFAWLCQRRWLGTFGRCCYSIYLFHYALMHSLASSSHWNHLFAPSNLPGELRLLIELTVVASTCLAGGLLLHHFIEKPFVAAGAELIDRLENEPLSSSRLLTRIWRQRSKGF
jgi:peptidoglycan/LPS O-acetylase OafA/YrhL